MPQPSLTLPLGVASTSRQAKSVDCRFDDRYDDDENAVQDATYFLSSSFFRNGAEDAPRGGVPVPVVRPKVGSSRSCPQSFAIDHRRYRLPPLIQVKTKCSSTERKTERKRERGRKKAWLCAASPLYSLSCRCRCCCYFGTAAIAVTVFVQPRGSRRRPPSGAPSFSPSSCCCSNSKKRKLMKNASGRKL